MSESALSNYKLELEDRPLRITKFARNTGGKDSKMSKQNQPVAETKAPKAKYSKTRGEHIKDVIIAILIAGVIAFVGGMHFESSKNAEIKNAVTAATTTPDVKK